MADVTHEPECHIAREVSGDLWFCCCEQLREREADHLAALERVRVEALREERAAIMALRAFIVGKTALRDWDINEVVKCFDDAVAAIDRLIDAATTGDTDD